MSCHGGKYRTNIIIFTEDFNREARQLILPETKAIAEQVMNCITGLEDEIRNLGFIGAGMNRAAFTWQMSALLLHRAVICLAGEKCCPSLPLDKWGIPCLCWAVETAVDQPEDDFAFGASSMNNIQGDRVQCMDFPLNGDMVHHSLNKQAVANVFLAIAHGNAEALSENDAAIAAELVKKGYVLQRDGHLTVNCPVFSTAQYQALLKLLDRAAQNIAAIALSIQSKEAALLCEHVPEHLKAAAQSMAYFRLFEDAISLPMARLYAERALSDAKYGDLLPTTYVVLAD